MKNFSIIAAADLNYGIGINNQLPWRIPSELQYFQKVTANSTVIMGRNTWNSLPLQSRPLKNRQNIVVSRSADLELPENVLLANSLEQALELAVQEEIFVIGGAQLYSESIKHSNCTKVYLTKIFETFNCDTFFPGDYLEQNFSLETESESNSENGFEFRFLVYLKD